MNICCGDVFKSGDLFFGRGCYRPAIERIPEVAGELRVEIARILLTNQRDLRSKQCGDDAIASIFS